jgi:hypothetical protein
MISRLAGRTTSVSRPEGRHHLFNDTMLKLVEVDMQRNGTVHGFRSNFRNWGQNDTTIARNVLEYCRHHIEGE